MLEVSMVGFDPMERTRFLADNLSRRFLSHRIPQFFG